MPIRLLLTTLSKYSMYDVNLVATKDRVAPLLAVSHSDSPGRDTFYLS